MGISKQIGWSQESNLIYQIVKQTEYINKLLPTSQSYYTTRVSKMIGWSTEANLYYEWLRSLDRLTQHYANCCAPITTTTTTTTEFVSREWCVWSGDSTATPPNYLSEYSPLTNQLTDLRLGVNDFPGGTEFFGASTEFKVWKYSASLSEIKEWYVNSYPASLTYSVTTPVGSIGPNYTTPDAICGYDNDYVLMSFYNNFLGGVFRTVLFNVATGVTNVNILPISISSGMGYGSLTIASVMVTSTNKIITVEQRAGTYEWVLRQWSLIQDPGMGSGIPEVQISLSGIPLNPLAVNNKYYVFTYNNEIYLGRTYDSTLFKVGLSYPYTITEVIPNLGWSQTRQYWSSRECNTVSFEVVPPCATAFPEIGGSISYYGRTVTNTFASGGVYNSLDSGSYRQTCAGQLFKPFGYIIFNGAPFTYELTFSSPINDIGIAMAILDYGDDFTITTDVGDPILSAVNPCQVTVVGNQIFTDSTASAGSGSGTFYIHTPTPFSVLTISGTNYGLGGPIWFTCDTSLPTTTTTSSTTTMAPPSGFNTIYTTFDIY